MPLFGKEVIEPFSLELAQRDFHGLLDEEMPFDEGSLAEAIRLSLSEIEMDVGHRNFLKALADSLDNPRAEWKLALAHNKPGKFRSPAHSAQQHYRDRWIDASLQRYKSKGMKTEAAVALLSEQNGWSRASIFGSLKRVREIERWVKELDLKPSPPRQSK